MFKAQLLLLLLVVVVVVVVVLLVIVVMLWITHAMLYIRQWKTNSNPTTAVTTVQRIELIAIRIDRVESWGQCPTGY